MKVASPSRGRSGFLLIESLVGIALFAMFIAAVGLSMLASADGAASSADRVRGILLSERALEAARSMRAESFSQLTAGDHGLKVGSGALGTRWVFDGTKTTTPDGYATTLNVQTVEGEHLRLTATTSWNHGKARSGSVVLTSELTDWQSARSIGTWTSPQVVGSYLDAGTPLFNDVALSGNYAFVTGDASSGGRGLYVFDISDPANPVRVAGSFNLNASGYDVFVKGQTLYVITSDASQEIRAYDVASPSSLSSSNLVASYDLPGSGRARAAALSQSTLFVGAALSITEKELYSFDVASPSTIVPLHAVDDGESIEDLHVKGNYAYIASADDASELRVAKVSNPSALVLDAGSGTNVTDVPDGQAVALAGTAALLGRAAGAAIDELILFDVQNRVVPTGIPGPWTMDAGAAVYDVEVEPGGRYAFVAAGSATKQLRVMDLAAWENGLTPERGYYTYASAVGRGLAYDAWNDRVYLVTNNRFTIFRSN